MSFWRSSMTCDIDIPVPRKWPDNVKSAFLHAISFASAAFTCACGLAAKRKDKVKQLLAELAQAYREIAFLKEEMELKDQRFQRLSPHRRPYYRPTQRMQILQLKAARGWSISQTAKAFLLNEHTVSSWMKRVDEEGDNALIQMTELVNKFPVFVRHLVRQLKAFIPALGKEKIAQVLARAGLHLGVTTVGRMLSEKPSKVIGQEADLSEDTEQVEVRVVTAKYPGHVYHCDLTVVPTCTGFWVPWLPNSLLQVWPFCWWVAVVIDHFSRSVIGFAVFKKKPTSLEIRSFLGRAFQNAGRSPRHIILDKDSIFYCDAFKKWCKRKDIRPRYGAVGKYGSVSVIERFIKSMKNEGTRKILVPLRFDAMRLELSYYVNWFNEFRPHSYLEGKTPKEVYEELAPANSKPRYEPRLRWPHGSPCASPQAKIKGNPGTEFVLVIGFLEGRRHLPIIELKRVA
jgi:transposase InsO family protein